MDSDDVDWPLYCWVREGMDRPQLDDLLTAAADGAGRFVLTTAHLDWLFCPYDGGADVFARSSEKRDALRSHYGPWLPEGDAGG